MADVHDPRHNPQVGDTAHDYQGQLWRVVRLLSNEEKVYYVTMTTGQETWRDEKTGKRGVRTKSLTVSEWSRTLHTYTAAIQE